MPFKIAIVVHGRFHAFELARSLIEAGHDVTLFTNYPRFMVRRFGIPGERIRSFATHGLFSKLVYRFGWDQESTGGERLLHVGFGRWACRQLLKESWDVIYSWSGISEDILRQVDPARTVRLLARGSTHIETQARLLQEEEARTGVAQDKPSAWRIQRELREYALADAVIVLSRFCQESFFEHGFPPDRLRLMVSGTRIGAFAASAEVIRRRIERIQSGAPLRLLNVGTFSFRKGAYDIATIARELAPERFPMRIVGNVLSEAAALQRQLAERIEFSARIPQQELPAIYAQADLFFFPTIEEGFPAVLAQAAASGLPILTTPNGAGHDVVRDDVTGWVLPARAPGQFIAKLRFADAHRPRLAEMARRLASEFKPRDWSMVARNFEGICSELTARRTPAPRSAQVQQAAPRRTRAHPRVALVVHGRFYAFDLARALLAQGVEVRVFTNYPRWIGGRFGLPASCMRTCPQHGALSRLAHWSGLGRRAESFLHQWFSRWAASRLQQESFDVVKCFSGVGEEVFRSLAPAPALKVLVRGSAHVAEQAAILEAEEQRVGRPVDRPSAWRIQRERREYDLAQVICVLSSFARRSFVKWGIPEAKLWTLPLGSELGLFRPDRTVIEQRVERIRSGQPLRLLMVSNFTLQKGVYDLVEIARHLGPKFHLRLVGHVASDAAPLFPTLRALADVQPKVAQRDLPQVYNWADLFLFTSVHDGFAAVLAEARASGLPLLATAHCAGPDIIQEGETGWVLPVRDAQAFLGRLQWCHAHRKELATMVEKGYADFRPRDWSDVATEFLAELERRLALRRAAGAV